MLHVRVRSSQMDWGPRTAFREASLVSDHSKPRSACCWQNIKSQTPSHRGDGHSLGCCPDVRDCQRPKLVSACTEWHTAQHEIRRLSDLQSYIRQHDDFWRVRRAGKSLCKRCLGLVWRERTRHSFMETTFGRRRGRCGYANWPEWSLLRL